MSYEPIRKALAAHLKAGWAAGAYAAVPIEWENLHQIDHNKRSEPFLAVRIKWADAHQASIELEPLKRQHGEIIVYVCVKCGEGTSLGLKMADVLDGILRFKQVDGVQLLAPRLQEADEEAVPGWYVWPLPTSFHYTD